MALRSSVVDGLGKVNAGLKSATQRLARVVKHDRVAAGAAATGLVAASALAQGMHAEHSRALAPAAPPPSPGAHADDFGVSTPGSRLALLFKGIDIRDAARASMSFPLGGFHDPIPGTNGPLLKGVESAPVNGPPGVLEGVLSGSPSAGPQPVPAVPGGGMPAASPAPTAAPVAPPPPAAPPPPTVSERALANAMALRGKPYIWGGAGPNGFDCSGLVLAAYKPLGIHLPHSSAAQSTMGILVQPQDVRPGDLVFFYKPVSHVGIVEAVFTDPKTGARHFKMVDAPDTGDVVRVQDVGHPPPRLFRRIVG